MDEVEILKRGDVRPISLGPTLIHALFHLEHPSATICIRTLASSGGPQWDYLAPYVCRDPFFQSTVANRKLQCIASLMKLEHPKLEPWVNDLVRRSDFQTVFGLLEMARKHAQNSHGFASFQSLIPNQDRYSRWTELARSIHGDLVDRAESVFKESDRKDNLIKRRAIVKKKEHRFLLALLLNVPDRTRLLEIVKSEYPEAESVELVADWVEELSHIRKDGSDEPNVLGIEDLGALSLAVLESLLRGKSLSDTTKFCCEEFGAEDSGEFRASVEAVYNGHLSSPIFSAQFG